ncbi:putative pentatricopeptide repeat-containing protein At3g01580 [Magnolia sinica]|uniref:putative pentatricopeptide repeat-containing protein At3g01580 n=1 Tax=Magnolia sinica TaxID=86752 RepID=UPI002658D2B1|nr:putative pentatricopeptide repeat-containing protein At3g01580 [Magnolia sinica]
MLLHQTTRSNQTPPYNMHSRASFSKSIQRHFPPKSKPPPASSHPKYTNQSIPAAHYATHPYLHVGPTQISPKTNCHNIMALLLRSSTHLHEARKIHGLLLVNGLFNSNSNVELASHLLNVYLSFDSLQEALIVFNHLPEKNVFTWNSILRGFVNAGQFARTIEFYHLMIAEGLTPDNFTYPLVLKACSKLSDLEQGKKIREMIRRGAKPNIFVECAMIDMFAKCGNLNEAWCVFDGMSQRDLVSWTAMICGTVQSGDWSEALGLFTRMRLEGLSPDSVIVATVLPASGRLESLQLGMALHGFSITCGIESDLCVSNALIDMYCKCGNTNEACHLFRYMESKDVISWSSLIAGHSQNCEYDKCLDVYFAMKGSAVRPSSVTIASILPAFANQKQLKQGKEIHCFVIRNGLEFDAFISSALIDMYTKCGSMREAELVFEITSDRDIAVWNSMIAGYALNGDTELAFGALRRIRESKFRPNSITIMSVVPICTRLGMLRQGGEIHSYAVRNGLGSIVSVMNPLIDMYCKRGYLKFGINVFEQMIEKDVVTYNTIIAALGMHGNAAQAFSYFSQMEKERIKPNKVTFIALLSACSHSGLIDRGWSFYNSMIQDYGITPEMEHYACMVDLLGRSGCLDEAWEFIKRMPFEPNIDVLGSLLGACRVHKRIELAELVGKRIFDKNPEDPGYYVLLSNTYAAAGRWADALKVRTMIKERGLIKKPGNSWIQVGCSVHFFLARDRLHPEFNEIQEILESLLLEMKDEGYIPNVSFSLDDLPGDHND